MRRLASAVSSCRSSARIDAASCVISSRTVSVISNASYAGSPEERAGLRSLAATARRAVCHRPRRGALRARDCATLDWLSRRQLSNRTSITNVDDLLGTVEIHESHCAQRRLDQDVRLVTPQRGLGDARLRDEERSQKHVEYSRQRLLF